MRTDDFRILVVATNFLGRHFPFESVWSKDPVGAELGSKITAITIVTKRASETKGLGLVIMPGDVLLDFGKNSRSNVGFQSCHFGRSKIKFRRLRVPLKHT